MGITMPYLPPKAVVRIKCDNSSENIVYDMKPIIYISNAQYLWRFC